MHTFIINEIHILTWYEIIRSNGHTLHQVKTNGKYSVLPYSVCCGVLLVFFNPRKGFINTENI